MLRAGVIVPVEELIVKAGSEVKLPPRIPVTVGLTAASEVQMAGYEMVAVCVLDTVTVVVKIKSPQPPVPGTVYFMV